MARRTLWTAAAVLAVALVAPAAAQGPSASGKGMRPHAMRGAMMGPGGMDMGMGGMGMRCPMMEPGAVFSVEKLENGVAIKLTSDDPKVASRLQKRAEIMRLVHELHQEAMASSP